MGCVYFAVLFLLLQCVERIECKPKESNYYGGMLSRNPRYALKDTAKPPTQATIDDVKIVPLFPGSDNAPLLRMKPPENDDEVYTCAAILPQPLRPLPTKAPKVSTKTPLVSSTKPTSSTSVSSPIPPTKSTPSAIPTPTLSSNGDSESRKIHAFDPVKSNDTNNRHENKDNNSSKGTVRADKKQETFTEKPPKQDGVNGNKDENKVNQSADKDDKKRESSTLNSHKQGSDNKKNNEKKVEEERDKADKKQEATTAKSSKQDKNITRPPTNYPTSSKTNSATTPSPTTSTITKNTAKKTQKPDETKNTGVVVAAAAAAAIAAKTAEAIAAEAAAAIAADAAGSTANVVGIATGGSGGTSGRSTMDDDFDFDLDDLFDKDKLTDYDKFEVKLHSVEDLAAIFADKFKRVEYVCVWFANNFTNELNNLTIFQNKYYSMAGKAQEFRQKLGDVMEEETDDDVYNEMLRAFNVGVLLEDLLHGFHYDTLRMHTIVHQFSDSAYIVEEELFKLKTSIVKLISGARSFAHNIYIAVGGVRIMATVAQLRTTECLSPYIPAYQAWRRAIKRLYLEGVELERNTYKSLSGEFYGDTNEVHKVKEKFTEFIERAKKELNEASYNVQVLQGPINVCVIKVAEYIVKKTDKVFSEIRKYLIM